jgi:hypothetical protein
MKKMASSNAKRSNALLEKPARVTERSVSPVQQVGCCGEFALDCPFCWSSGWESPAQDTQYFNLY